MMISDSEIRLTGMQSLIKALGEVQAERFIALIRRESFDYTKWQEKLFEDLTLDELSSQAQSYFEKNQ
ncbi:hypothetical protein [Moraxella nasicaprae]|uniref:Uncharacterized protein n=1 Tax=Moraxella nasicaprae TaxID=2904122 RepID=A0ABY6F5A0_9GAMM|nr:hypothetical protein [Moraxella nasicaprae]UXZ05224.1 hypothetical protein LU297_01865 [Moraxella nasicaprae]